MRYVRRFSLRTKLNQVQHATFHTDRAAIFFDDTLNVPRAVLEGYQLANLECLLAHGTLHSITREALPSTHPDICPSRRRSNPSRHSHHVPMILPFRSR